VEGELCIGELISEVRSLDEEKIKFEGDELGVLIPDCGELNIEG
jgi:hypothetical protein